MGDADKKGGSSTEGGEKNIEKMFAKMMTQMESYIEQFRADLQALNSKVEAITLKDHVGSAIKQEKSHRGNRVSFGGESASLHSAHERSESPEMMVESESRRSSGRFSFGSSSSQTAKDIGTKLERPKFTVEKSFTKDGYKTELVQDSDYLNFLDEYDHYIDQWKTIPSNEGQPYPNESRVAIVSIPPKYARKIAARIHWIYDTKELQTFGSLKELKRAKYWSDLDSETLRIEIGKLVESELSTKGVLEAIRKVRWNSTFGIIDQLAFATFQHDFKRTVMRLQSGGVIKVEQVHLKDYLISALPDKQLQSELIAKFGQTGVIIGDIENFAINDIFSDIELYIQSISKLNLGRLVNKQNREREGFKAMQFGKFHQVTAFDDQLHEEIHPEDNEELQDQVNLLSSNYQDVKCRHSGVGSDGKLKCKWLADNGTCLFKHPDSDISLKGKGVSKDFAKSTPSHTRKVQMVAESLSGDEEDS
jgi:hypothetical protein